MARRPRTPRAPRRRQSLAVAPESLLDGCDLCRSQMEACHGDWALWAGAEWEQGRDKGRPPRWGGRLVPAPPPSDSPPHWLVRLHLF